MASLQFEGAFGGIDEKQEQFIREVIEKQGFKDNKVRFEGVGQKADHYYSEVKRIIIVNNGKDDLKMILKMANKDATERISMNSGLMFRNEILMYEQVLPKLASLQESIGVPENDRIKFAKCYGCISEEPREMILLEDLIQSGYVLLDRFVPLEEDAVKITLKHFSILHSLSFVLKHLEPETFERFKSSLPDAMAHHYENEDSIFFTSLKASATAVLEDENVKKTVHDMMSQWVHAYRELLKYENENPDLLIFQQGDGWTNNILFKIQDGKAVDCVLIDYQISKATNPAADLLYMIFNCTDHIGRTKHFHEWLDYYHEELDKSLTKFGLQASRIYPRSQLDFDLKKYSKLFFCICVILYSMTTRNEEEATRAQDAIRSGDLGATAADMGVSTLGADTLAIFKSKITDLVDSYYLFGFIA